MCCMFMPLADVPDVVVVVVVVVTDPVLPPVLLLGLLYFSFNMDLSACIGICSVQDCPEARENVLVTESTLVGVGCVAVDDTI